MKRTDTRLHIPDMKCAGCADRIQTVLDRVDGVRSAAVDLEDKEATVTYDADTASPDALLAAVEKAGFSPTAA